MGDISSIITESKFNFLAGYHESFELSEDASNYILTFTGSGDDFKEVAYGVLKELGGEEAYQSFTNIITDISGIYELTFAKDTFYLVALKMNLNMKMDMGAGEIHTIDQIYYLYSNFNEIDEVVVPEDAINNAK